MCVSVCVCVRAWHVYVSVCLCVCICILSLCVHVPLCTPMLHAKYLCYFLISGSPKPIRKLNLKMHTMKVTGDNVNCEGNK